MNQESLTLQVIFLFLFCIISSGFAGMFILLEYAELVYLFFALSATFFIRGIYIILKYHCTLEKEGEIILILEVSPGIGEDCSICLQEAGPAFVSLKCEHSFHPTCIEKWIKIKANCPICRAKVDLRPSQDALVRIAP